MLLFADLSKLSHHLAEVLRSPEYYEIASHEIALNHKFKRSFADHTVIKYEYEKFK